MWYRLQHCYFVLNNTQHCDYTVWMYDYDSWQDTWNTRFIAGENIYVDNNNREQLNNAQGFCVNVPVPRGSSIYTVGPMPYPIDDIRKYYKIKRNPDAGDFNILGDLHIFKNRRDRIVTHFIAIEYNTKTLFVYHGKRPSVNELEKIGTEIGIPSYTTIEDDPYCVFYKITNADKSYQAVKNILEKKFTKPLVYHTALDLKSSMELTVDPLLILLNTGKANNLEDFRTQLRLIGQYNYEDYPKTLEILFDIIRNTCRYDIRSNTYVSSQISKTEANVLNARRSEYKDDKDMMLAQKLIDSIMNIGKCRYPDVYDFFGKLGNAGIKSGYFCELFNCICKITPKNFENKTDNQTDI